MPPARATPGHTPGCADAFAAVFGPARGSARPPADGVLTPGDHNVLARFLVCHPREGDYLVGRAMTTNSNGKAIALHYDGELIACGEPGALVVASEGLSDVAARVRDEVVNTARSFGSGVRFARRLSGLVAAADLTA